MAKPMCPYCGVAIGNRREHVIPRELFETLPTNGLTVKACEDCNNRKSEYDDYFRAALMNDWKVVENEVASQIKRGAYHAAVETNRKVERQFLQDMVKTKRTEELTSTRKMRGVFEFFQPDWGKIQKEIVYMVKGVSYKYHKSPIPQNHHVDFFRIGQNQLDEILTLVESGDFELFWELGTKNEAKIYRHTTAGSNRTEIWAFNFYGYAWFMAGVIDQEIPELESDHLIPNPPVPNIARKVSD